MSKASEWAKWWTNAAHLATDPRGYRGDRPRPVWGVKGEPKLALVTDLGSLSLTDMVLNDDEALALARWIDDMFIEPPR